MSPKPLLLLLLGLPAAAPVLAAECSPEVSQRLERYARLADSLHAEKPGVLRVYAADGSMFTGPEALWTKGQVRAIEQACRRGDAPEAEARLATLRPLRG